MALTIGLLLIGVGRDSGTMAGRLDALQGEIQLVKSSLSSLDASMKAARSEQRTDMERLASTVTSLDRRVIEVDATQRASDRRWEETNRIQDDRQRVMGDILTAMRDEFVRNGLRLSPPQRRQNGSIQSGPQPLDLRPVRWLAPLEGIVAAP
nr:hypothetical protein [Roseomonas sp. SXEYE001]